MLTQALVHRGYPVNASFPFLLSVIILITICSPSTSPEHEMLWDLSQDPRLGPLSQMLSQETSCNIQGNDIVKSVLTLGSLQKPQQQSPLPPPRVGQGCTTGPVLPHLPLPIYLQPLSDF